MSVSLWKVYVGGLWMELREHRGGYTSVFGIIGRPEEVAIVHLGKDREHAHNIFARKVECHRTLVGAGAYDRG